MSSEIFVLRRQLLRIDEEAAALLRPLSQSQAEWRPAPDRWAVLDCLEHVALATDRYLPHIDAAIEAGWLAGRMGCGPFASGRLERWLLRHAEPPPRLRMRAAATVRPGAYRPAAGVLNHFIRQHDRLRGALMRSEGLDWAAVSVPHPGVPFLRITLGGTFALLAAHARRHMWQARQVALHPDFPKPRDTMSVFSHDAFPPRAAASIPRARR